MLSSALRSGARKSVASTLGILAANTAYFLLSATSVGALLMASYNLFFAVKWIGAAYLIFLGLRALAGSSALAADAMTDERPARRLFADGFLLQAANPKAIVFFTALLPQFIQPSAGVPMQVLILGVSSIVLEFVVLGLYVAQRTFATDQGARVVRGGQVQPVCWSPHGRRSRTDTVGPCFVPGAECHEALHQNLARSTAPGTGHEARGM